MLIAVEGCCHGDLDKIYTSLTAAEREFGVKVDLLIVCGDFQSVRNSDDLESLACPAKYRQMGDFRKYFEGDARAPVLTVFIGGNHEASNYLWENYYGGYVAENIYFLGNAGVIEINGLRIAGMSGIFKANDYNKGYYERPPYDPSTIRSIYHQRAWEVEKLKLWKTVSGKAVDVCLTHDWPRGVYHFGDTRRLLRIKKDFVEEVQSNTLGSPASEDLMNTLRPSYHFSAHLHIKFSAVIPWENQAGAQAGAGAHTRFLALDKCLPNRGFIQVLDVKETSGAPAPGEDGADLTIHHDVDWLAVVKATAPYFPTSRQPGSNEPLPHDIVQRVRDAKFALLKTFQSNRAQYPSDELVAVPPFDPAWRALPRQVPYTETDHPHTQAFCDMLGIENRIRRGGSHSWEARAAAESTVASHLRHTSVVETKTQLSVLASELADATKLLDDLLDEDAAAKPAPVAAVPTATAMRRPGAKAPQAPPQEPAPVANDGGDDDDDDELFGVFVDT